MGDLPHNIAQFLSFQYDFWQIIAISVCAIIVGWQMPLRLRYDRISNNAMLVGIIGIIAAASINGEIYAQGTLEAALENIIAINFGTIMGLYVLAWMVIFIINALKRRIRNQNKSRFIFKR